MTAGNRPTATIRDGWSRTMAGNGTWSTVHRWVGTFSFVRHACLGLSDNDAQQRTLEIQYPLHGPRLPTPLSLAQVGRMELPLPLVAPTGRSVPSLKIQKAV